MIKRSRRKSHSKEMFKGKESACPGRKKEEKASCSVSREEYHKGRRTKGKLMHLNETFCG